MNKFILSAAMAGCLFAGAPAVDAHLPRLERGNAKIEIKNPESSQAFYGWLAGTPAVYSITSGKPFLLYLGLLSPQIAAGRMDYSTTIRKDGESFAQIPAEDSLWMVEYEPFGNDYYLKGPEYQAQVPAGEYEIEVYNSGNSGNYVLVAGKTEDLSPGEFLRTLAVLPAVKEEFFGKNWWEAYNNLVGLAAFIMLVFILIAAYFIVSFIRRRRLKSKLDREYSKLGN